jgi:hypothetical protein
LNEILGYKCPYDSIKDYIIENTEIWVQDNDEKKYVEEKEVKCPKSKSKITTKIRKNAARKRNKNFNKHSVNEFSLSND